MAKKKNNYLDSEEKFEITAMIDLVFLLLVYFMYLPLDQEADLFLTLPVFSSEPAEKIQLPSEQIVEIKPDGSIFLNGSMVDNPNDLDLKELALTLYRLKTSADRNGINTIVSVYPDADSMHQSTISVLNACAKAGIKHVSFAEAE